MSADWNDASTATYTAVAAHVHDRRIIVCLDDEGPILPAYCWEVEVPDDDAEVVPAGRLCHGTWVTGWESSVPRAKRAAIRAARELKELTA